MNNPPKHIAIIMDGNGRWAKSRGLSRTAGHEEGAKTVREITTHCSKIGVKYLTLYAFSTENWTRPKLEVEFLMKLLQRWFTSELPVYLANNVKFKAIGDISKFSKNLQKTIKDVEEKTAQCTGLTQILALNYGSRDEIVRATKKLIANNQDVNEENIAANLDTARLVMLIYLLEQVERLEFLTFYCGNVLIVRCFLLILYGLILLPKS